MNWNIFFLSLMLLFTSVAGIVKTITIQGLRDELAAERACHPGMAAEVLTNGRALCVGGKGETWVVER
jgi:hypothetical protein